MSAILISMRAKRPNCFIARAARLGDAKTPATLVPHLMMYICMRFAPRFYPPHLSATVKNSKPNPIRNFGSPSITSAVTIQAMPAKPIRIAAKLRSSILAHLHSSTSFDNLPPVRAPSLRSKLIQDFMSCSVHSVLNVRRYYVHACASDFTTESIYAINNKNNLPHIHFHFSLLPLIETTLGARSNGYIRGHYVHVRLSSQTVYRGYPASP